MSMRCEDVERCLDDRFDGCLEPERDRELDEHLASCPECRQFTQDIEDGAQAVREAVDALPFRPDFTEEILGRLAADRKRTRRRGSAFLGAGVLTALAASLLILPEL